MKLDGASRENRIILAEFMRTAFETQAPIELGRRADGTAGKCRYGDIRMLTHFELSILVVVPSSSAAVIVSRLLK